MQVPQALGQPVYPFGYYLVIVGHEKKDEPEQNKFDISSKADGKNEPVLLRFLPHTQGAVYFIKKA